MNIKMLSFFRAIDIVLLAVVAAALSPSPASTTYAFGPSSTCSHIASRSSLNQRHQLSSTKRYRSSSRSNSSSLWWTAATAASFDSSSNKNESSASSSPVGATAATTTKQQKRIQQIRAEGGPLAFNTKFGALNPFAIYYGLVSIGLGLIWFMALSACQLLYTLTGNRVDKKRRIPVFLSHVWGTLLMTFTGCFPRVENGDIVKSFHKSGRKAMFVSNHNSWMDIPFLGYAIGWHNYKFVAKKELEKVPILGKAIKVAENVLVDRSDRKSQLLTLKQGIKWLDDGVNLCTFPEGTRSRSGRLMPFKNGAFKMAHKAGAPVIPISICGAANIMPSYWMFPYRPAGGGACTVIVHEPVESKGRSEEELATAVRDSIIAGLPEEQRPLLAEGIEVAAAAVMVTEQPSESTTIKVELPNETVVQPMIISAVSENQLPQPSA